MSQQINLLIQDREQASAALPALIGLGVVLVALIGYWGLEHFNTAKIKNEVVQGEQKLLAAKTALQARLQGPKTGGFDAEIAALKARLEASREALSMLQKGGLGNPEGYSGYLTALANIPDNNLWLTSIVISNVGKTVNITGRAMNNEAVLRYARRLNERFSVYGVQFTSLEMTPETFGKEGAAQPLSTVAFKLF